ncbi:MAG: glycosyltransferase [Alphaproteobacteria bacterium]|nr:glycosyltransferase [Alphaproteobacteria bacterium]
MKKLSVAIIIPVKGFNDKLKQCLEKCLELDYVDYEVMVFPDELSPEFDEFKGRIRVISTGSMGPAEKRDLALKHSNAEIFAFLDDDAYPEPDWLKNAVGHFEKEEVAAVGGPSVTPPESTFASVVSGIALSCAVVSGPYTYRYVPGKEMEVKDYPSCNFIVRRDVFEKLGGFDTTFWPGEDTKLCLQITHELKKKIIYDPEVLVYHHRRPLFIPHLKQVWSYALHRGYFVKKFSETSLKLSYFLPSLLFLSLVIGVPLSFASPIVRGAFLSGLSLYLVLTFASSIHSDGRLIPLICLGILSTHLTYGVGFLRGLAMRRLAR